MPDPNIYESGALFSLEGREKEREEREREKWRRERNGETDRKGKRVEGRGGGG